MRSARHLAVAFVALAVIVSWSGAGEPPPLSDRDARPDLSAFAEQITARTLRDPGTQRPAATAIPARAVDRITPPSVLDQHELATKHVAWGADEIPYVIPSQALPFRYRVEQSLADLFGLDTVIEAMSAWDGVAGSRWSTQFDGIEPGPVRRARQDGVSMVYLRSVCPSGWLGYAAWNVSPDDTALDARYGSAALYVTEVDIALCPGVRTETQLRATLAHEVGHAMGMAHLCGSDEPCGDETGMSQPERTSHSEHGQDLLPAGDCRPMRALVHLCEELSEADRMAARHLHPTLPRLAGRTAAETAARASYATTGDRSAPVVVMARTGGSPHEQLVAANLSGVAQAPLLLGDADPQSCLAGPGAEELARVATRRAQVLLVGLWPESCEDVLGSWGLSTERLNGAHHVATALQVADRILASGRTTGVAFLVTANPDDGELPGGLSAAASGRGPVLLTPTTRLAPAVADWLRANPSVHTVYLMGDRSDTSNRLIAALRDIGVGVVRVGGPNSVALARAAAEVPALFASAEHPTTRVEGGPVVIAPQGAWSDGVVAASVAARTGAHLLVTGERPHPAVVSWLREHRPAGGYVVGGPASLPYPTQWHYSEWVGGSPPPTAPQRATLQSAIDKVFRQAP